MPVHLNAYGSYRTFKYAVYAFLTLNIGLFFQEEWAALEHRFASGLALSELIEGFASTIDTTAWVVLLLMFELETTVLREQHRTPTVNRSLQIIRCVCYAVIVYALAGYLTKLQYLQAAVLRDEVDDLCALVSGGWSYAVDLDEYVRLTIANCSELGRAGGFRQFSGVDAIVDSVGYLDIVRLAWVDVINSATWLTVVAVLEAEVQLQNRGRLSDAAYRACNVLKIALYAPLFAAAVYWGAKGDFVDFWDAFLWLVAFFFIERNVVEWHADSNAAVLTPA